MEDITINHVSIKVSSFQKLGALPKIRKCQIEAALFLLPLINHVGCMYQDAVGEVYENLNFNVQKQQSQDYTLIL